MSSVKIRDMDETSEYFVGTCTHVDDTPNVLCRDEIEACVLSRIAWLRDMHEKGLRVKIAYVDGEPMGFIHLVPIEACPWGPLGRDLLAIPCLVVVEKGKRRGIGQRLITEAEQEAKRQNKKGIVTVAYYTDFWFMPASFFERCGFVLARRKGEVAILWKVFDRSAEVPIFLERNYQFKPVEGKVVVDLFWNTFCQTSNIEAQRVREVVAEFRDSVVLREYCADDHTILRYYQIPRGIFINGKKIEWGHEAPKVGIREAISQALDMDDPEGGTSI